MVRSVHFLFTKTFLLCEQEADLSRIFCLYSCLFDYCLHPYGMHPVIKGLSHGLKTCPVAVPDICLRRQSALASVDRCHSLTSLYPPPAALGSLPTGMFS
jgi:hypothetical protein